MNFSISDPPFRFRKGSRPLLISMPHVGTHVPPALAARLTDEAKGVPDTDWHLERLYDFADALGASVLVATHSRYVIDLNRPPDDETLYPGQDTTGLCPVDTFDKTPIYAQIENALDEDEVLQRRDAIWKPYHDQLSAELTRLRAAHRKVALWDAHSIRSQIPRFFEGCLPNLNLGTANGASCAPSLAESLLDLARASRYSAVLNGRFKGGYITRQYGNPAKGVHAIQLEMAQCVYMDEIHPFSYRQELASKVQPTLWQMLNAVLDFVER
jgi:N-formylglutamate deformylase